jgi:hypothetical protein
MLPLEDKYAPPAPTPYTMGSTMTVPYQTTPYATGSTTTPSHYSGPSSLHLAQAGQYSHASEPPSPPLTNPYGGMESPPLNPGWNAVRLPTSGSVAFR